MIPILRNFIKGSFLPSRKFRKPRIWSNNELKKFGALFVGSVINVSGKVDSDKDGGFYKDYFPNAEEYFVSNYRPRDFPKEKKRKWDFDINLDEELSSQFLDRFDVVFNHTTLEHIFDADVAFSNLCDMSKDIVIVVVPFMQQLHFGASYKDYWRFSPYALKEMFERKNLSLLYLSSNKGKESIYLFAIGSKNPDKWKNKIITTNEEVFKKLGDKLV